MPVIISRREAFKRGFNRYFTGEPCIHGHVEERKVSSNTCIMCDRLSSRKYLAKKRLGIPTTRKTHERVLKPAESPINLLLMKKWV